MRLYVFLIILLSFPCFSLELNVIGSSVIKFTDSEENGDFFRYLEVANNGAEIDIKGIDYEDGLYFSHREWLCKNNAAIFQCEIKKINNPPVDFVRAGTVIDIGYCRQSIDMTNLIAHDADKDFFVLEDRKKQILYSLDKKTCLKNPITLNDEVHNSKRTFQQDFMVYIGAVNGIVYYYYESKDVYGVLGVGQYDLYGRSNKKDDEIDVSKRFWIDVGVIDFSKTGILAVTKHVDRDVPKEKLGMLKGAMDTYKSYICFYMQENLKLSKESCHDIIPVDKNENSISIESLAISDNGKFFAFVFKNENNEYEMRSYELR